MSFRSMKLELQTYVPELNALECGIRLNRSYQTLLDMHQWSFIKQESVFNTLAQEATGTVTVVAGSTTVTGIGTAFTAAMAGRFIKLFGQPQFYKIATVDVALQTLTLEGAAATGVTSGGYNIFQHQYPKPTSCKHISNIRRQLALAEKPLEWLDGFDPDREGNGEPIYWANFDNDTIEIYPVPDQVYTLRIRYLLDIPNLAAETDVPLLPENLIITHAVLVSYRKLATRVEGQQYAKLIQDARTDFASEWNTAYETDLNRQSLPTQVQQAGEDLPVSSDFWMRHDPFWAGF